VENRGNEASGNPTDGNGGEGSRDRGRNPNDPNGDPGGDPGDDPSLTEVPGGPPDFACHFHKLDPIKYGPWTDSKYGKCHASTIKALRRIK
jgi:hypothetical protein